MPNARTYVRTRAGRIATRAGIPGAWEHEAMAVVARLLTFVDLVDGHDDGPDASTMSVSARHEAVLADGRRILLLDDRGWSESMRTSWAYEPSEQARDLARRAGVWQYE